MRRSTPTRKATKASSTSGRQTRCAACSTPDEYEVVRGAVSALDRDTNFEGEWHLHVLQVRSQDIAERSCRWTRIGRAAINSSCARHDCWPVRNRRVWPGRDEKILTSWNGLAIAGLAAAVAQPRRLRIAEAAARAADFLREHCWHEGRLLAVHKDGRSRFPAYLDDYASLAWGLLELVQARWHARALHLGGRDSPRRCCAFRGSRRGRVLFTADDHEQLILRPKTFADDATPAGNGVAARLLVRLGFLLGEPRYLTAAERTLRAAWPVLEKYPHGHTTLAMALDELTAPPAAIVLRGEAAELAVWQSELDRLYDPRRLVLGIPADATDLPPALAEKKAPSRHSQAERSGAAKMAPGQLLAYVCRGMQCGAPVESLPALIEELRGSTVERK